MNKLVLYTMPRCPKCTVLKKLLDKAKIDYELFDDAEAMAAMGMTSAPMLRVNETLIGYFDAIKWVNAQSSAYPKI